MLDKGHTVRLPWDRGRGWRGQRGERGWVGFGGKQRGAGRPGFQRVVGSLKLGGTHWERPRRKTAGAASVRGTKGPCGEGA